MCVKTIADYHWGERDIPWTVIGKGPTFQAILNCSPPGYRMGINQVVRELKVNVAIFMDYEHLCEMRNALKTNASAIFLPTKINVAAQFKALDLTASVVPVVTENLHKIYFFKWIEGPDSLLVLNNTAEAAFGVLCRHAPCSTIYSAGIDGGREYHPLFSALPVGPEIDNRKQFAVIQSVVDRSGKTWERWKE